MMRMLPILLFLTAAGCSKDPSPVEVAQTHVKSWQSMGMCLPEAQVPFFAANFTEVANVLTDALCHPDNAVRQRAAYIIEGIGDVASPLEPDLVRAIKVESVRVVRLYLYAALRAIGSRQPGTVEMLKNKFEALTKRPIAATDGVTYTATDERIYLSSAIYCLTSDEAEKSKYISEVTQWLVPPAAGLSESERDAYWEHRWCAVNSVKHMKGAQEALPLLEAMLTEEAPKPWVSIHVPEAIVSLQNEDDLR